MEKVPVVQFALFYAQRGFYVFPCSRDKKPLVKWADECTRDPEKIKQWYRDFPGAGVAIVTGAKSGIIVLDVDRGHSGDESLLALVAEHGPLPHTVESLTGGGGRHIIFLHPGVPIHNSASKLGPGLDIRGDGGYIVAPPSDHPSGHKYEWEASSKPSQTPMAPMPTWLITALVDPAQQQPAGPAPAVPGKIGSGSRNQTLASLAGTMRRRGFNVASIFQALLEENRQKCEPPLSHDEVMAIAQSVSRYEPTNPPQFDAVMNPPEDEQNPTQKREPRNAFAIGTSFMDMLENLGDVYVKTGIPKLDEALGGLERKQLYVLTARPSVGKTTFAWQIARCVAMSKKRVLFVSLEMSAEALWAKAACGVVGIRWRDVKNGTIDQDRLGRLYEVTGQLMNDYGDNLLVDDGSNSTASIWSSVEKCTPDLVVIDHLRFVSDKHDKEHKRLGIITYRLKEIAKAFGPAMLCLAQLNRNLESRENKRPTLSDLRDSGEIEENADVVMMLHRDDYYDTDEMKAPPNPLTEVLIRKFRDDIPSQRIALIFDKPSQWFIAATDIADAAGWQE